MYQHTHPIGITCPKCDNTIYKDIKIAPDNNAIFLLDFTDSIFTCDKCTLFISVKVKITTQQYNER